MKIYKIIKSPNFYDKLYFHLFSIKITLMYLFMDFLHFKAPLSWAFSPPFHALGRADQVLQYVVYLSDGTSGGSIIDLGNFSTLGAWDEKTWRG